jgi:hydroxypyruvate reductase
MTRETAKATLARIFNVACAAVDPEAAVKAAVRREGSSLVLDNARYDLSGYNQVRLLGVGKGAAPMAKAVEELLGDELDGGLVIVKHGHGLDLARSTLMEAGHPVPDEASATAGRAALEFFSGVHSGDLLVVCLTGGASAVMAAPRPPATLADKQAVTRLLLASGADIGEINALRKHLSLCKGGRLAEAANGADILVLVVSDVVGNDLSVIASGPFYPDPSTYGDCLAILERYELVEKVPAVVREMLEAGARGEAPETPKPGADCFATCTTRMVADLRMAMNAAAAEAKAIGITPLTLTSTLKGEAREVAKVMTAMLREAVTSGTPLSRPGLLLAGGETTVTLRGQGKGGRSQELALAAALELDGVDGASLLAAGTDGNDGPTNAAGGFAFGDSVARMNAAGLDPHALLANNDAYHALAAVDDLLITGPTRTNVMDLVLGLVE